MRVVLGEDNSDLILELASWTAVSFEGGWGPEVEVEAGLLQFILQSKSKKTKL